MTKERVRRNPRDRASMRRRVPTVPAATSRPVRILEDGAPLVAVLLAGEDGALSDLDRQAVSAGRCLADALGCGLLAFCTGSAEITGLGDAGVDSVATLRAETAETLSKALQSMVARLGLRHVLSVDDGIGAEALRRLAARAGLALRANVRHLDAEGCLCLEDAGASERRRDLAPLLLVAPGQFRTVQDVPRGEAAPLEVPDVADGTESHPFEVLEVEHVVLWDLPLAQAPFILGGGAGVGDWSMFHRLAEVLGAAEGGSRVACDAGDLPRDRQVGASGTIVSARCYIALGISGAVQHLQGIEACRHVIAVNPDPHAPIHQRADLSVVADAGEVMARLLSELGARG